MVVDYKYLSKQAIIKSSRHHDVNLFYQLTITNTKTEKKSIANYFTGTPTPKEKSVTAWTSGEQQHYTNTCT